MAQDSVSRTLAGLALLASVVAGYLAFQTGRGVANDNHLAIFVFTSGTDCKTFTFPQSVQVKRNDDVTWDVAGFCSNPHDDVRIAFQNVDPVDLSENTSQKKKGKVKNTANYATYKYSIFFGGSTTPVEDPELVIVR